MQICHISDTHGYHELIKVPKCDVLIHTGDVGRRTTVAELMQFLVWMEKQPADKKIFIGGNHDICLDKDWVRREKLKGSVEGLLAEQHYRDAKILISSYDIKYLEDREYVYQGVKFYGSPYSCSFHRHSWVFNADRGQEISRIWSKIPSDVDVLLTHTPVYDTFDDVGEYKEENGDSHAGCKDLFTVMKKRLFNLKLHCSGHIHDQYGVIYKAVSNTRRVLFSNGAVLTNKYKLLIDKPLIITI